MKQFDLDEYLANPSRKVVTRNGRDARIICTDRLSEEYPVVALWHYVNEKGKTLEEIETFTRCGQVVIDSKDGCDLFFAPERKEGWVNIFPNNMIGGIYESEKEAKTAAFWSSSPFTTIKIEWEE